MNRRCFAECDILCTWLHLTHPALQNLVCCAEWYSLRLQVGIRHTSGKFWGNFHSDKVWGDFKAQSIPGYTRNTNDIVYKIKKNLLLKTGNPLYFPLYTHPCSRCAWGCIFAKEKRQTRKGLLIWSETRSKHYKMVFKVLVFLYQVC